MQRDPASGLSQPLLHKFGVMIARVVEKDMNESGGAKTDHGSGGIVPLRAA